MSRKLHRRDFVKGTAAVGVGVWTGLAARESKAANERIAFGCIGVGGKGGSDSNSASKAGDVVAICDIDDNRLDGATKHYPKAQKFSDYRKLLDKMGKSLDAVTVSTPDHTHAPASIRAMKLGLHCFCQKPLTHSVYEARQMAEIAAEKKLATQMGNQGTANSSLREASAIIKSGVLGTIKEIHVWTNRPGGHWTQGVRRPKPADPPKTLHWDLWLGAAPYRPFGAGYHPFKWRGWWDFGTGALGDMACHTFNMPYMACDLYDPTSIEATSSGHNKDSYPKWSIIKFAFPANKIRPAIPVTWYDGGKRPDKSVLDGKNPPGSGAVVIGTKGKLYGHGDYCGSFSLLGVDKPKVDFERSPGHFVEFARAIKGGPKARSSFDGYAGGLTETILLGNLSVWAGKKIEWDAKKLKATNAPEVEIIIRKKYREGFGLG